MRALILIAAVASSAFAQTAEQKLPLEAMPEIRPGEARVVPLETFSPAAKDFFLPHVQDARKATAGPRIIPAAPGEVELISRMVVRSTKQQKSTRLMTRAPSDLSTSPISAWELIGTIADSSIQRSDNTATRLLRILQANDKQIAITEWDYLADGGGVMQIAEFVNATVNGAPAVLIAQQDSGGRALWHLTWSAQGKSYIVNIFEPHLTESTGALALSVAASISR